MSDPVAILQKALEEFKLLGEVGKAPPIEHHFPSPVLKVISNLSSELSPFIDDNEYLSHLHCAAVLYFLLQICKYLQ
jgi:hypothetical protein